MSAPRRAPKWMVYAFGASVLALLCFSAWTCFDSAIYYWKSGREIQVGLILGGSLSLAGVALVLFGALLSYGDNSYLRKRHD